MAETVKEETQVRGEHYQAVNTWTGSLAQGKGGISWNSPCLFSRGSSYQQEWAWMSHLWGMGSAMMVADNTLFFD